jgi:glycosyltransferase involved in cell wall biosynthesis
MEQSGSAPLSSPLVTIIIVNYNYGKFVEHCIRSVDQQDYPNIQCIVMDCASNDNSLEIINQSLERTASGRFQLLRRASNLGHILNAISAIEEIKGVFVTFLDADDLLFPEFVSTHVSAHLNELQSAAVSVTDQVQINAAGEVLSGTCHWHQKSRTLDETNGWIDLTRARSWAPRSPYRIEKGHDYPLHYVPAWWSSWVAERWIWNSTSALMFRKAAVESFIPPNIEPDHTTTGFDAYFARATHSIGGTLLIDSAQGAYRRHGKNLWSPAELLGGQTPSGRNDPNDLFRDVQKMTRRTLVANHHNLVRVFGGELYYSVMWQLMSNQDFYKFAATHNEDKVFWEKIIATVKGARA